MMFRTPVCSYPIIVSHLSFNVLCLLILYSIYLNGQNPLIVQTIHGGKNNPERSQIHWISKDVVVWWHLCCDILSMTERRWRGAIVVNF